MKIYEYSNCGTCRKALKFLEAKKIQFEKVPIREKPPTKSELKKALKHLNGNIKALFNTSGQDYKSLNLKDKISKLSEEQLLELLNSNGNLVKRPFLVKDDIFLVGFKEEEWAKKLF